MKPIVPSPPRTFPQIRACHNQTNTLPHAQGKTTPPLLSLALPQLKGELVRLEKLCFGDSIHEHYFPRSQSQVIRLEIATSNSIWSLLASLLPAMHARPFDHTCKMCARPRHWLEERLLALQTLRIFYSCNHSSLHLLRQAGLTAEPLKVVSWPTGTTTPTICTSTCPTHTAFRSYTTRSRHSATRSHHCLTAFWEHPSLLLPPAANSNM